MVVSSTIRNLYQEAQTPVGYVAQLVDEILKAHCYTHGFLFESRIKTVESVAEKIESGRCQRWGDLDDLYACTIIVPLVSQEPGVLDFLRSQFQEIAIRGRSTGKRDPEAFRFDSTRFVGKLRPPGGIDAEAEVYRTPFEVQIKTTLDYAWQDHARAGVQVPRR